MVTELNLLVGGEAGQGIQSVGMVLAKTLSRSGFFVFADQDYESRVRGGHNFVRVRAGQKEVLALSEKLDILIALNRETVSLHEDELKPGGVIIFDGAATKLEAKGAKYLDVPLAGLAENKLMTNTVAVGAALGLCGGDFEQLATVLKNEFAKAGESVVAANIAAAKAGFEFVGKPRFKLEPAAEGTAQMLLHGNQALSLGAMVGGCKFMSGYPMTPSSSIMEYLADKGRSFGVVALHVEDEIAAVNMAVGAAFAGVRAMVATSGGGFSLMVEGLSLAAMTETPLVLVLGQRPGPATGMPTRTEQGELWFALHAGHGEFPRAVLAPATAEEAFYLTIKAFNLAEKYQTPVIILTDHHLANSYYTTDKFDLDKVIIDRGRLLTEKDLTNLDDYKRHLVTESGISPRAFPLEESPLVVTDSDEHDEAGHMIEDGPTRSQQTLKRLRKLDGLRAEIGKPRVSQSPDADVALIGWGSSYGAIKEAAAILTEDGAVVSTLHLSELWPFPASAVASFLEKNEKSIVIEGNATGQLAQLIRRETGQEVNGVVSRFDGRPLSPRYIVNELKKEVV